MNGASIQAIKILTALLDSLPTTSYSNSMGNYSTQPNLKEVCKDLCETQQMIDIILENL